MQIRKKYLRLGGILILGLCALAAVVCLIYGLFFYDKPLPEPVHTSVIQNNTATQMVSEITVEDIADGQTYSFQDAAAMEELLDGLQAVELYRETENSGTSEASGGYEITLHFSDDISVAYYLHDDLCTNSNGTLYECADTGELFVAAFEQQVADETYSRVVSQQSGYGETSY